MTQQPRRLAEPVAAPLDALRIQGAGVAFELLGEPFLLMPEQTWLALQIARGDQAALRQRACGRVRIAGARHVILDAAVDEPSPTLGGSIARVLTRREFEIAVQVAQGDGNKDIARRLGISPFTVREHIRRICHKLGVRSRTCIAAAVGPVGSTPRL